MRSDSKSPTGIARRLLLLGAALLVAGCSTGLRLGYNYADTLLAHSIDGYVGLTPEQGLFVKERAAGLIAWHRATQLRDYAQLIETTRGKLDGTVSADDVLTFNREVNSRLAALGERAAPDLVQLAMMLTPEQMARLQRKLAKDNSKARRELVQLAGRESVDDRVRKYTERANYWFGELSREQVELLRAAVLQNPGSATWWVEERERRQRELLVVLQRIQSERPSDEIATAWLRTYFAGLQQPAEPDRRDRMAEFRLANAELIAQLINASTPEQKAHLSRRLAGFAQDFAALAAERSAPPPG
jgi:hypothetical protein